MKTVVPGVLHVLIKSKDGQKWEDKTWDIRRVRRAGNRVVVTFSSDKEWWYGSGRVRSYDQVMERKLGTLDLVYVNGVLKQEVTDVYELRASDGSFEPRFTLAFPRVTADENDKPITCTYGKEAVTLDLATPNQRQTLPIMKYVREEVRKQARRTAEAQESNGNKSGRAGEANTTPDAILANQWEKLPKAPSGSALEAYLRGVNSAQTGASDRIVMPFHANIDQRNAIRAALANQLSVIDGPPGTGKTQTILNLIATLVMQGKTVGIVAGANSAVENLVDKLTEEGYGFLVATLGSLDRVTAFCASQTNNDKNRAEWQQTAERSLKESPEVITPETLRAEEERLVSLWQDSRESAPCSRKGCGRAGARSLTFHTCPSRARSLELSRTSSLSLAVSRGRGAVFGDSLNECAAISNMAPSKVSIWGIRTSSRRSRWPSTVLVNGSLLSSLRKRRLALPATASSRRLRTIVGTHDVFSMRFSCAGLRIDLSRTWMLRVSLARRLSC